MPLTTDQIAQLAEQLEAIINNAQEWDLEQGELALHVDKVHPSWVTGTIYAPAPDGGRDVEVGLIRIDLVAIDTDGRRIS